MRTKTLKKNKINVVTLGCSKNVYDSEVLMGQLRANDKEVVHEEEGNVVVINTCGFIANAKEQSVNTILEFVQKKEAGEVDKVFVTGCLSERYNHFNCARFNLLRARQSYCTRNDHTYHFNSGLSWGNGRRFSNLKKLGGGNAF